MFILVYRRSVELLKEEIRYLRGEFRGRNIRFKDNNYIFDFSEIDTKILFFTGDPRRTSGLRPDYYNTDTLEDSYFIRQSADKVNGIEVCSPDDIVKIILRLQKKYDEERN